MLPTATVNQLPSDPSALFNLTVSLAAAGAATAVSIDFATVCSKFDFGSLKYPPLRQLIGLALIASAVVVAPVVIVLAPAVCRLWPFSS